MAEQTHSKQQYLPNSAIICTKFLADEGVCTVTDFMPRPSPTARGNKPLLPWLVRRVEVIRGTLKFRMECFPAFDYARQAHTTSLVDDEKTTKSSQGKYRKKAVFKSDLMTLELRSSTGYNPDLTTCSDISPTDFEFTLDEESWPRHKGPGVVAEFELQEGQTADFILREDPETAEDVQVIPNTKPSRANKPPLVDRDGPLISTPSIDLAAYDPLLDDQLVQSLLDAVCSSQYRNGTTRLSSAHKNTQSLDDCFLVCLDVSGLIRKPSQPCTQHLKLTTCKTCFSQQSKYMGRWREFGTSQRLLLSFR